jgi:hypothetical protein
MDPEEYEQIFGYLSDKKYPNDLFGLFNLIAIKNTHMLCTCQTSPP